jgi:hypothetical protein
MMSGSGKSLFKFLERLVNWSKTPRVVLIMAQVVVTIRYNACGGRG